MIIKAWENMKISSNYKSFSSLNLLINLRDALVIQETDAEKNKKIISEIEAFIDNHEMELVQILLMDKKLNQFSEKLEFFIERNIGEKISIDNSFWDHIDNMLNQFKAGIENGCGSECFDAPELIFSEDCNTHDVMYSFVDSKKEKDQADDYFFFNMKKRAKNQYQGLYPIYKTVAKVYYKGVNVFGTPSTNIDFKKTIKQEKPLNELAEFYDEFLGNRLIDFEKLKENYLAKDFKSMKSIVHSWKGYSDPYGFNHLTELSKDLEYYIEKKNTNKIEELIDQVDAYLKIKAIS